MLILGRFLSWLDSTFKKLFSKAFFSLSVSRVFGVSRVFSVSRDFSVFDTEDILMKKLVFIFNFIVKKVNL
jgi:hypothetical protein